jgi:hypothetical protein
MRRGKHVVAAIQNNRNRGNRSADLRPTIPFRHDDADLGGYSFGDNSIADSAVFVAESAAHLPARRTSALPTQSAPRRRCCGSHRHSTLHQRAIEMSPLRSSGARLS